MDRDERRRLVRIAVEHMPPPPKPDTAFADFYGDSTGDARDSRTPMAKLKYRYAVQKLLGHYFDIGEEPVTISSLYLDVQSMMEDLHAEWTERGGERDTGGEQQRNERMDDDELLALFEERMAAFRSAIRHQEQDEYTFWFPWHIRLQNRPSEFQALGLTFEPASGTHWETVLNKLSRNWDSSDLRELRDEINTGQYDIWTTTVTAANPEYPVAKVTEALELLSAQLNHAATALEVGTLADRDGTLSQRLGTDARWTAIQKPIGLFWEAVPENEPAVSGDDHRGYELLTNGGLPETTLDYEAISDRYEQHTTHESSSGEDPLYDALSEYQRGLTADTPSEAFYFFWRALELLAHVEDVQNGAEIIDTAVAALEVASDGEYDPTVTKIAPELWEIRTNQYNKSGWSRVRKAHEQVSKVLADALIDHHITTADRMRVQ